ncbi:arginine--tRNA ligase [Nocardia cyriacigeorgica]|uniref:Arginine--tRNA ligase n=1 Tax=Nocardia cyriacigeorgica TaxID=135487 RepID=A0A6P1CY23_9NOCA|nr:MULTISPECIES: arginine--tRNA ligase [Nocardia]NEW36424.1 arginine--tRNA ligase [Nocardia cyriacigeorgica]
MTRVQGSVRSLAVAVADAVSEAMAAALPGDVAGADPLVRRSDHADFQSNVALSLAKKLGRPPREVAGSITGKLRDDVIAATELSGPGFVNITVTDSSIWSQVAARRDADRLGVGRPLEGERVVIDYSSPNIAKQMHVGHLRTTIIGDALARSLSFLGAQVIRQNHLGDWGTQFGMLIQYIDEHPEAKWHHDDLADGADAPIAALDRLYRQSREKFDADAGFADRARARVVALQAGDADTLRVWGDLVAESQLSFQALYDRLGVLLTPQDSAGESTYNRYLDEVTDELVRLGIAVESNGALCVFFDEFTGPDGNPVPLIVRKSDGGYGYAATDLATIRYRVRDLEATKILYVVDARQAQHFEMVFATARRVGWLTDDVQAIHVPFGTVLGPDGKPFKTRSGSTIPLTELLDSAVDRAREIVAEKAHGLDAQALDQVAEAAGIGSVKYADLSGSRIKDYVFDVDRMVNFTGNTGVYLQYAHARIRSILSNVAAADTSPVVDTGLVLEPAERALGLQLDEFGKAVADVTDSLEPHRLAGYLYALAQTFTSFYEACPVLKAEDPRVRGNRIALCQLTGDTLAKGLDLMGIAAPERI